MSQASSFKSKRFREKGSLPRGVPSDPSAPMPVGGVTLTGVSPDPDDDIMTSSQFMSASLLDGGHSIPALGDGWSPNAQNVVLSRSPSTCMFGISKDRILALSLSSMLADDTRCCSLLMLGWDLPISSALRVMSAVSTSIGSSMGDGEGAEEDCGMGMGVAAAG